MKKKKVMIMGAGGTAGINFIKSLRMTGRYHIIGCDINKWHLESCDVDCRYIVPYCTKREYISAINDIIKIEKVDFIHAQPDMEVEVLSENRERINTKYFLPKKETIRFCRDKMITNSILSRNGISVPESYRIVGFSDLRRHISKLKKSSKQKNMWVRATKGAGSKASIPVQTFRQITEWIRYWRSTERLETKDFMISEFLPGKEYAFQSLWYNGNIIVSQARQRLEYLMGNFLPSGQSSSPSVAVTIHNPIVNRMATRAILAIDKYAAGIFCVDLKENTHGIPCVTEINCGRFFTTSNFFSVLGCNMPDYYIRMGLGLTIPRLPKYNIIKSGYYWIRGIDILPKIVEENTWRSVKVNG